MSKLFKRIYSRRRGGNSIHRVRLPDSDEAFAAYTMRLIGIPLSVGELRVCGDSIAYRIAQPFDEKMRCVMRAAYSRYYKDGRLGNTDYEMNSLVMRGAFGNLSCGGIAAHAYGQTRVYGHRHRRRIEKWIARRRQASRKQVAGSNP